MERNLNRQQTMQTNVCQKNDSDSCSSIEDSEEDQQLQQQQSYLNIQNQPRIRNFSPQITENQFQQSRVSIIRNDIVLRKSFLVIHKSNSSNTLGINSNNTTNTTKSKFKKSFQRRKSEFMKGTIINLSQQNDDYRDKLILKKQFINLKDEEDQDMVIKILKKPEKSQLQKQFLAKSIEGLSLFQKNKEETLGSEKSLFQLCKHLSLKSFKKHEVIFNQGDFGKEYFIVIKGSVLTLIKKKIIDDNDDDSDEENETKQVELTITEKFLKKYFKEFQHIFTFGPGTAFGEIALMTNEKRTATMVCKEDTQCMVLSREGFNSILKTALDKISNDKFDFVSQFSFFKNIARSNIDSFLHQINVTKFQKNCVIYNNKSALEGQIYFIRSGEVLIQTVMQNDEILKKQIKDKSTSQLNLEKLNKTNIIKKNFQYVKKQTVVVKGPNTFFGDYEYLNKIPHRIHRAVVSTDAEIYCFNSKKLIKFLKYQNLQHNSLDYFIQESMVSHQFEESHLNFVNNQRKLINKNENLQKIQKNNMPQEIARSVKREGYGGPIVSSQHQDFQNNLLNEKMQMSKDWKQKTEEEKQKQKKNGEVPLNYLIKQNYENQEQFQNHQLLKKKLEIIENEDKTYRTKSKSENVSQINYTIRKVKSKVGFKKSQEQSIIDNMPISYFQDDKLSRKFAQTQQKENSKNDNRQNKFIIKILNKFQHKKYELLSQSSDSKFQQMLNQNNNNTQNQIQNQNQNYDKSVFENPQFQNVKQLSLHKKSYSTDNSYINTEESEDLINYQNQNQEKQKLQLQQIQQIKQNLEDQELITPRNQEEENLSFVNRGKTKELSGFYSQKQISLNDDNQHNLSFQSNQSSFKQYQHQSQQQPLQLHICQQNNNNNLIRQKVSSFNNQKKKYLTQQELLIKRMQQNKQLKMKQLYYNNNKNENENMYQSNLIFPELPKIHKQVSISQDLRKTQSVNSTPIRYRNQ